MEGLSGFLLGLNNRKFMSAGLINISIMGVLAILQCASPVNTPVS